MFRGEIAAIPRAFSSDDSVKAFVRERPYAIGFIDAALLDGAVKAVKVGGKSPGEPGYPLSHTAP
jgi:hypothetical protein